MKQFGPIIVALLLVGAIVTSFIYHRSMYQTPSLETSSSSVGAEQTAIKNAADYAQLYVSKLTRTGQVPVKADSLSKNPSPLFNATE